MAREIRAYQVTIPAGTPVAAPYTRDLTMPSRIVRVIGVRVPRGPSGLMGFQLGSKGQQIIPWEPGSWLVMDDDKETFDVEGQIDTGAWQLLGYNTGRYDHTVYLTFQLDPVQLAYSPQGSAVYVPVDGIGSGDTGGGSGGGGSTPATYAEGYAAGRVAATVAVQTALGIAPTLTAPAPPDAGTVALQGWSAAVDAAIVAAQGITADADQPAPSGVDGAAIARRDALAAIRAAFGLTGGPAPVPAPAFGQPGRAEYDATRAAAIAAVAAITEA